MFATKTFTEKPSSSRECAAREAKPGHPAPEGPVEHHRHDGRRELLRHERPDAEAGDGQCNAHGPAGQRRHVRSDGEALEVHPPLEQRVLDDAEAPQHEGRREGIDDALQLGQVVGACPPAAGQERDAHEGEAPREVEPERRVEVLLVEVLPLDDRGAEPLLHEPVDEGDVDESHRHDAEVVRTEDRGEHERKDRGQSPLTPVHRERPGQWATYRVGAAHQPLGGA